LVALPGVLFVSEVAASSALTAAAILAVDVAYFVG